MQKTLQAAKGWYNEDKRQHPASQVLTTVNTTT